MTDGDDYLGGQDIDNRLIDYVIDRNQKETRSQIDIKKEKRKLAHFKKGVNFVKTELAGQGINHAELNLEALGDEGYSAEISRAKFEEVVFTEEFIAQMLNPLERIIKDFKS